MKEQITIIYPEPEKKSFYQTLRNSFFVRQLRENRAVIFATFLFSFIATFTFLGMHNQNVTEAASTSGFKAGNIISDAVMTDYNSMNVDQIQTFLKSKASCNQDSSLAATGAFKVDNVNETVNGVSYNRRYYFYYWSDGQKKTSSDLYHVGSNGKFVCMADEKFDGETAAYIIWEAAQTYKINPKVLIVLLQKEQGLVTDTWPRQIQYRSATGYGCPDSAACSTKYYGFKNQVGNAAYHFSKVVYENKYNSYPVGKNYIKYHYNSACGGSTVNVENRATGALYTYTPYQPNAGSLAAGYGTTNDGCGAYGNRNFYLYYTDWFGDTHAGSKSAEVKTTVNSAVPVLYQSHIQDIGWEKDWITSTKTSGTTGQSKRLEAVNIKLSGETKGMHIYYQSHLENIGWETKWVEDGNTSGTTGQARRLEAIRIKLDDTSSKSYDVYYRAHIEDYGWLAWTKNGYSAGSEGLAKRLEALEIVIVKKGDAMPKSTNEKDSRSFIK